WTWCFAQQSTHIDYPLVDPLQSTNGEIITSIKYWETVQRPSLLKLVENQMYGVSPEAPKELKFVVFEQDSMALSGTAIRKQVAVYLQNDRHLLDLLIYLPNQLEKPVPIFLGLNFEGNHTLNRDKAIRLSDKWVWIGAKGSV